MSHAIFCKCPRCEFNDAIARCHGAGWLAFDRSQRNLNFGREANETITKESIFIGYDKAMKHFLEGFLHAKECHSKG